MTNQANAGAERPPIKPIGGLDLNVYCFSQVSGTSTLIAHNVYGWRCTIGVSGELHGIDMHHACRTLYGRSDTWAEFGDFNDPYSWRCFVEG
ncbi:hypothetical protein N8J89_26220 [Crossiella sp. CA-258035]|uniref:hypothetical protein n=1 Tax=Crossiella sp. CA-258035 TaxID=2981138 RepID=UPI0024BCDFEE|nr:hypothetical protein [Crossiella sp. CA-258035]WHT16622.1 hypothetical protein N8J89_26220 [Crossiella sp. CA-258035]